MTDSEAIEMMKKVIAHADYECAEGISECKDFTMNCATAALAALKSAGWQHESIAREKLAAWMIHNGFATGHGDTIEDLLDELNQQLDKLLRSLLDAIRWPMRATASDLLLSATGHTNDRR